MSLKFKIFLIFFLIFFLNEIDFSQIRPRIDEKILSGRQRIDESILFKGEEYAEEIKRKSLEREFILEDAIDPKTYIIGPGDVVLINLWGEQEKEFEVMVLPEGNVILPSIGSLMVNGLTLEKMDKLIKEKAMRYYTGSQITVSLGDIRTFKVHVTGEVVKRGSYNASPVDRVSQVINMAEGVTSWANRRKIEIRHLDGSIEICNLLEFEIKGNIENNPFVKGGDIIHVPRVSLSLGMVLVSGNVKSPGYYQLYKGETIGDLIERINVVKETTDWEDSYIKRTITSSEEKIINIPLDFIDSNNDDEIPEEFLLKNNDHIYLPLRINEVYVYGAVKNAGSYPFYSNMISADYAGLAGKAERAAPNSEIKVIKKGTNEVLKGGGVIIERGDKIEVPLKTMETAKDYLQFIGTITSVLIAAKAVGIIN